MEKEILYTITQKLKGIPGIDEIHLKEGILSNQPLVDGMLQIRRKGYQQDWHVAVKRELTPAMLPQILQRLQEVKPLLLMAAYITPNARQLMQQENVAYADMAGNMYLADDQLLLYIETGRSEKVYQAVNNRAFTKTGLKVVYLLLQHPGYLNETYRFLAEKAETGLDTINKVFKALLQEKYILPLNSKKYKWNKREQLLQDWVNGYAKNLKPKLQQRTFRSLEKMKDWKEYTLPPDTCWGGANAGDLLTNNLIAEYWTVYTRQDYKTLMKELKWIPDPNGNIQVLEKFWEEKCEENHVPPIIAYADLLEGDNPRYMEIAKTIYERYLQNII
ncbi:type IV toxin-antitoxin system AbiEi family antitoxin [Botryobacter ruber]|uniref:type IV toxin-antitoxin system AbiEi family antitoxin n=1 Tax=Botryobacter ruber TaxID=2171629 RepID=UPI000F646EDA|nr:type IV toxin-antitoxin system AbiEi family antitoxin [Botryobacter ruber]